MKEVIRHGRFREDLYYRLKVIDIELPPLRERREDIPLLVEHFVERFGREPGKRVSGVSKEALKALVSYAWPGNVRELENVIQRAITLCRHEVILPEDLPASLLQESKEDLLDKGIREKYTMDQLEKEYVRKVLIAVGGNKSKAAQILGFDRKTLYRKLEDL
jgi:DNA-binding NtrC family response regulator